MSESVRNPILAAVTSAGLLWLAGCGSPTPTAPVVASLSEAASGSNRVGALNQPPALRLKTTPKADKSGEVWTLTGVEPFKVKLNLCTSDDPEQVIDADGSQNPAGDQIDWQFNFGEPANYVIAPDGTPTPDPAFEIDGRFRADHTGFCRVEHVYETPGTYVASVSVTDRHLEDQARNVAALARRTQRVKIVVLPETPPDPDSCVSSTPIPELLSDCDDVPVASFFGGEGLTYSAAFSCPADASSGRVGALAASWSIDPTTGVINEAFGSPPSCNPITVTVTATNSCGASSQTFTIRDTCG